ncbi:MAG: response regulator [Leptolyngbyaceae cyanobacterium]
MAVSKVMIVEDESIISLHIKGSLLRLGYSISGVAASGEAALRKIETTSPDLVLMDIHLKGDMTGIEVSKKIESDFQIPIIYLTANADSLTFQEAKQTSPYSYILKPFQEKELGMAIELALHQHQKKQRSRSSEAWYASAFQALQAAVIATNTEGSIVFMNAYAEMMTGWTFAEAFNQPITEVFKLEENERLSSPETTKKSFQPILRELLDGHNISLPDSLQLLVRPGTGIPLSGRGEPSKTLIPIEGNASPIQDHRGDIAGNIFIFRRLQAPISYGLDSLNSSHIKALDRQRANDSAVAAVANQTIEQTKSEDAALIKSFAQAFVQGESVLLSTPRLIAEANARSITLASKTDGIIINVKTIDNRLTAIVKQDSPYWEMICQVLTSVSFFPVSQRTNGICYCQYRAIPEKLQVYSTSAVTLWNVWDSQVSCHQVQARPPLSRSNILVLRRGSWYHIQRMAKQQGNLQLKTIVGDVVIPLEDSLIWGVRSSLEM